MTMVHLSFAIPPNVHTCIHNYIFYGLHSNCIHVAWTGIQPFSWFSPLNSTCTHGVLPSVTSAKLVLDLHSLALTVVVTCNIHWWWYILMPTSAFTNVQWTCIASCTVWWCLRICTCMYTVCTQAWVHWTTHLNLILFGVLTQVQFTVACCVKFCYTSQKKFTVA